jgi:alanyl-tRNA synthetase
MMLIDGAVIWKLKATHGMPLDMTLDLFWSRRMLPTWAPLLKAAQKDGANIERLVKEIRQIVSNTYPTKIADHINLYMTSRLLEY